MIATLDACRKKCVVHNIDSTDRQIDSEDGYESHQEQQPSRAGQQCWAATSEILGVAGHKGKLKCTWTLAAGCVRLPACC